MKWTVAGVTQIVEQIPMDSPSGSISDFPLEINRIMDNWRNVGQDKRAEFRAFVWLKRVSFEINYQRITRSTVLQSLFNKNIIHSRGFVGGGLLPRSCGGPSCLSFCHPKHPPLPHRNAGTLP